jgi:hypothetical protein
MKIAAMNAGSGAPATGATRQQRRDATRKQAASVEPAITLMVETLKELPHMFHMTFTAMDGTSLWAARPEHLTISSEDLTMKYGAVLDDTWTVLAIADAMPGERPQARPISQLLDAVVNSMEQIRQQFGRPNSHIGITPLAIFKPIKGLAEIEASEPSPGTEGN